MVEQLHGFIDIVEGKLVRDEEIEVDQTLEALVDEKRQLCFGFEASENRGGDGSALEELHGMYREELWACVDAKQHCHSNSRVCRKEGLSKCFDASRTLEAVLNSSLDYLPHSLMNCLFTLLWIYEFTDPNFST